MYVVRRAFRNYGEMMLPGSVIEPGNIKRFKTRLKDRYIVEVTEQDFDKWNSYFVDKVGAPIRVPEKPAVESENKVQPKTQPEVKAQPAAKKVARAAAVLK